MVKYVHFKIGVCEIISPILEGKTALVRHLVTGKYHGVYLTKSENIEQAERFLSKRNESKTSTKQNENKEEQN